ncbi:MAG: HAD family hydrolase [Actinomycetales bacterium]|nr:HAD family hydrolase [Actinomycetales bacterium]
MDGTLLTQAGELPEGFAAMRATLRERGIAFVPASGRQHATLALMFPEDDSFVADNGSLVAHEGRVIGTSLVARDAVRHVIELARAYTASDLGVVVCGVSTAYIERTDPAFVAEVDKYYASLEVVEDLTLVADDVLKVAIFDFDDAEPMAATMLRDVAQTHQVVVSSKHWVDVMHPEANKGVGVKALQAALGVGPAQTVAFGDYLNDLELLDAAGLSFAMANAHPEVHARARYVAPRNVDDGVLRVLAHLLG